MSGVDDRSIQPPETRSSVNSNLLDSWSFTVPLNQTLSRLSRCLPILPTEYVSWTVEVAVADKQCIMITGDNPLTAVHVAKDVEIVDREVMILDLKEGTTTDGMSLLRLFLV